MSDRTGRCFCGAVTWATAGPVLWAGHCHCVSCRRATASPMTSFFGVPRDSVTWSGEVQAITTSGGTVARLFCPACGTQMSYQSDAWPDESHLYAATMDDPDQFEPQAHFHYGERLPWLQIEDDLPKYAASADDAVPLP